MKGWGWAIVITASAAATPAAMPCQTRGRSLICQVFGAHVTKTSSAASSIANFDRDERGEPRRRSPARAGRPSTRARRRRRRGWASGRSRTAAQTSRNVTARLSHDQRRVSPAGAGPRVRRGRAPCSEAPDDERPGGAVPETGEEHHDHEVAHRPQRALPRAAERDVEVVAQPGREAHVPAAPELRDVPALNGELKFCGKLKPSRKASPTAMSE